MDGLVGRMDLLGWVDGWDGTDDIEAEHDGHPREEGTQRNLCCNMAPILTRRVFTQVSMLPRANHLPSHRSFTQTIQSHMCTHAFEACPSIRPVYPSSIPSTHPPTPSISITKTTTTTTSQTPNHTHFTNHTHHNHLPRMTTGDLAQHPVHWGSDNEIY